MSASARVRPVLTLLWWCLGALLLWLVLDWAVFKAVFLPDESACKALAHHGACWGVIAEKYRPLLFGRYPYVEQWRAALSLLVLLAGSAGLLWRPWRLSAAMAACIMLGCGSSVAVLMYGGLAGLEPVPPSQWGGLPLTLVLAWCSLSLSLPLALMLALGRRAPWRAVRWAAQSFIEVVRGLPLVMLLFMAAFMLPMLLPAGMELALIWRVGLVLTLFSSAYLAEIIRGGLQTIGPDQYDAAQVLGLSYWQTQRLVVLPQAMRAVLPAMVNHAIGLLKDTSLVMVVSLHELTGALSLSLGGDPIWRPYYFEAYLFVGAIYALMCLSLAWSGRRLERHWLAPAGQQ